MSLNRVGLELGGGERGSNESRTTSLKRSKCECLQSPLVRFPSAESPFRHWLVNLPSEKQCWMAASPIHAIKQGRSLCFRLPCKNVPGMEGVSSVFSHALYQTGWTMQWVFPKVRGNQTQSWHMVGLFSKEKGKKTPATQTTKNPVSKICHGFALNHSTQLNNLSQILFIYQYSESNFFFPSRGCMTQLLYSTTFLAFLCSSEDLKDIPAACNDCKVH